MRDSVVLKLRYLAEHGFVWTLICEDTELHLVIAQDKAGALRWCKDMSDIFLAYKQQVQENAPEVLH